MSGPLDELRSAIFQASLYIGEGRTLSVPLDTALAAISDFERDHPGLVDLTVCGPQCPAYWGEDDEPVCWARANIEAVRIGEACPVLAWRAGT